MTGASGPREVAVRQPNRLSASRCTQNVRETRLAEPKTIVTDQLEASDAFARWVSPHLTAMGNLASRLAGSASRDDVVQDALTRAWRKRHLYDADRGTLRTWLLAIVADRARRVRQRRRPDGALDESNAPTIQAVDGTTVDIERAVASLPPRMKLTVDCVYFVGLTIAETAIVMNVSEGTVKSTLADARAKLRTRLEVKP
jgi:RNA polymerase sigma factor (sigma-70 family)